MITCNTPDSINAFRLLALRGALKLELVGMKARRGFSAYKTIKAEFGFKGDKQSVHEQFANYLREQKILIDKPAQSAKVGA